MWMPGVEGRVAESERTENSNIPAMSWHLAGMGKEESGSGFENAWVICP